MAQDIKLKNILKNKNCKNRELQLSAICVTFFVYKEKRYISQRKSSLLFLKNLKYLNLNFKINVKNKAVIDLLDRV